jgi:hypothetical protein
LQRERGVELGRGPRDGKGRSDDVRIEPELFDRADPVAVGRDHAEPHPVARALLRRDLRDGRGLADARRPDECFNRRQLGVFGGERRKAVGERLAQADGRRAAPRLGRERDGHFLRELAIEARRA